MNNGTLHSYAARVLAHEKPNIDADTIGTLTIAWNAGPIKVAATNPCAAYLDEKGSPNARGLLLVSSATLVEAYANMNRASVTAGELTKARDALYRLEVLQMPKFTLEYAIAAVAAGTDPRFVHASKLLHGIYCHQDIDNGARDDVMSNLPPKPYRDFSLSEFIHTFYDHDDHDCYACRAKPQLP